MSKDLFYMDITELPIGLNSGQQNMDKVGANINDTVRGLGSITRYWTRRQRVS